MPFDLTASQQQKLVNLISWWCYGLIISYCLIFLYMVSGFWTLPGWFYRTGNPAGADFLSTWTGPYLALQGKTSLIYDPEAFKAAQLAVIGGSFEGQLPFHNPPSALLLMLPLGLLPYLPALFLWLFLPFAGLLILVARMAPHPLTLRLAMAFPAIPLNFFYGQGAFLITSGMGAGLLLLDTYPLISGLLFAIVINYKPHLGLLVLAALLFGRYWRTLMTVLLSTALLMAASALVFGVDTWIAFYHHIAISNLQLKNSSDLWNRMTTIFTLVRIAGGSVGLATTIQIIVGAAALLMVAWFWYRQYPLSVRGSLLVLGIFLCTPYAYEYDLVLLLLPMIWFAELNLPNTWSYRRILLLYLVWFSPIISIFAANMVRINIESIIIAGFFLVIATEAIAARSRLALG